MKGLTVRWSLADAPQGIEQTLVDYVADTSFEKFAGKGGLHFKTWRMVPGEWFEGCYVFESSEARQDFQDGFTAIAAEAPGSQLIGSAPILIEACEVPAVVEGGAGFAAAPRF